MMIKILRVFTAIQCLLHMICESFQIIYSISATGFPNFGSVLTVKLKYDIYTNDSLHKSLYPDSVVKVIMSGHLPFSFPTRSNTFHPCDTCLKYSKERQGIVHALCRNKMQ